MIILAGTPIGNLGDASPRLKQTLEEADVLAAEDTRVAARLMTALGITNRPRTISMFDHNERSRIPELLDLARDHVVVVVTDAGMPTVSDPGFHLVAAAHDAGVLVTAVPGPSAVLTALALAGLPTDRFAFDGFVPRKRGDRERLWERLRGSDRTTVLFESPRRLGATLEEMAGALGDGREVAVCREMTKLHEEVRRGGLREMARWASEGEVRGEIVIVVSAAGVGTDATGDAAESTASSDLDGAVTIALQLADAGTKLSSACAEAARRAGVPRRDVYAEALRRRER